MAAAKSKHQAGIDLDKFDLHILNSIYSWARAGESVMQVTMSNGHSLLEFTSPKETLKSDCHFAATNSASEEVDST